MIKRISKKENLGITLIALVITIVVLVILAGITISLTLGQNGLFKRTLTAKEEYVNAERYEKTRINSFSDEIESEANGRNGATISSTEVSFTPSNSNWKTKDGKPITNVKQALDYLYDI